MKVELIMPIDVFYGKSAAKRMTLSTKRKGAFGLLF